MANALQFETSPYLLQHAQNPVNWLPWNTNSLQEAKDKNKLIIVSIGYSSCHWCHVMEHESFENELTAQLMNEHFICIKVDREERPDIDNIYMEALQILNGSGGWPLNMFLTPDAKPFYGGTYFPPKPMHNRPSWNDVLLYMVNAFTNQKDQVYSQANKIYEMLGSNRQLQNASILPTIVNNKAFEEKIIAYYKNKMDTVQGGFGAAPKFPNTMNLQSLLKLYSINKDEALLNHVTFTIDTMIKAGIYDQLGGGFARYATDAKWNIPHFEKMLYDNALLLELLADVYIITKNENYKNTIAHTVSFLKSELMYENTAFYTALDADSEGVEGKYYTFTYEELLALIPADIEWFTKYYNIEPNGNWEHTNILYRTQEAADFALSLGYSEAVFLQKLQNAHDVLLAYRNKRVVPLLDDKILIGWNALMVSALAKCYQATSIEEYSTMALKCYDFLLKNMSHNELELLHTYKNGQAKYAAYLDDYAYVIQAAIALYNITQQQEYLLQANNYAQYVIQNFSQSGSALFTYTTPKTHKDILLHSTEIYDSATPSGNSVMLNNLIVLQYFFENDSYADIIKNQLLQIQAAMVQYPTSFGNWIGAALLQEYQSQISITGALNKNEFKYFWKYYLPFTIIITVSEKNNVIKKLDNYSKENLFYVCQSQTCYEPTSHIQKAVELLK